MLTKPYKECSFHGDTSFKPLTALIGPAGGPAALRMKVKKKFKKDGDNFTHAQPRPLSPY